MKKTRDWYWGQYDQIVYNDRPRALWPWLFVVMIFVDPIGVGHLFGKIALGFKQASGM